MNNQRGATLIEVLITVVVMSVGLLGLGATQMISLKNANQSNQRYFASMAAYDIAERMRANPIGAATGAYNFTAPNSVQKPDCNNSCTPAELAVWDLNEWQQLLTSSLPAGNGVVAVNNQQATITVNWTQQRTDKSGGQTNSSETQIFALTVGL